MYTFQWTILIRQFWFIEQMYCWRRVFSRCYARFSQITSIAAIIFVGHRFVFTYISADIFFPSLSLFLINTIFVQFWAIIAMIWFRKKKEKIQIFFTVIIAPNMVFLVIYSKKISPKWHLSISRWFNWIRVLP